MVLERIHRFTKKARSCTKDFILSAYFVYNGLCVTRDSPVTVYRRMTVLIVMESVTGKWKNHTKQEWNTEEIAKIEDLLEIPKTASAWVRRHPHEDEMLRKNNSYRC